jgi:2,3-dihydroxyphenylpropionate 1,2-dioxygenase
MSSSPPTTTSSFSGGTRHERGPGSTAVSEIIGLVGVSHSPFAALLPPADPSAPGGRFLADAARVASAVTRLAPDAVVVIGPDHFHANFYDVMPPFVLGVESAEGFGDYGSRPGPLPVAPELAWPVRDGLAEAGFDVALSYALTVDHGVVQSYDMICGAGGGGGAAAGAGAGAGVSVGAGVGAGAGARIPLVPLVVNTAAPPLPSMERCAALGSALGAAIRAASFGGRVLLIASGGLSHWLPSNDPRDASVAAERRAAVIHGRRDVRAFAAAREPAVLAMAGDPNAPVNREWDGWFLKQLSGGDLAPIAELGDAGLEESAGRGGHEIRTWLTGLAAVGAPLVWTSYEAVPEWITGMGIGTTFEVS